VHCIALGAVQVVEHASGSRCGIIADYDRQRPLGFALEFKAGFGSSSPAKPFLVRNMWTVTGK